jgi:hypothetical protein
MKDKDKLAPVLRAFKNGDINFDYAMNRILHIFSNSKRFNLNSFLTGLFAGITITFIIIHFTL